MKKLLLAIFAGSCLTMAFANTDDGLSSQETVCKGITKGSVWQVPAGATEQQVQSNCIGAKVVVRDKDGNDEMTVTPGSGKGKLRLYFGGTGRDATFQSAKND